MWQQEEAQRWLWKRGKPAVCGDWRILGRVVPFSGVNAVRCRHARSYFQHTNNCQRYRTFNETNINCDQFIHKSRNTGFKSALDYYNNGNYYYYKIRKNN